MDALHEANSQGFSMEKLQKLAQIMVDCNMLSVKPAKISWEKCQNQDQG